jgi:hypothetical protein
MVILAGSSGFIDHKNLSAVSGNTFKTPKFFRFLHPSGKVSQMTVPIPVGDEYKTKNLWPEQRLKNF